MCQTNQNSSQWERNKINIKSAKFPIKPNGKSTSTANLVFANMCGRYKTQNMDFKNMGTGQTVGRLFNR
jgi:hypothetical protein